MLHKHSYFCLSLLPPHYSFTWIPYAAFSFLISMPSYNLLLRPRMLSFYYLRYFHSFFKNHFDNCSSSKSSLISVLPWASEESILLSHHTSQREVIISCFVPPSYLFYTFIIALIKPQCNFVSTCGFFCKIMSLSLEGRKAEIIWNT